jgi:alpha-L-rhamnosidase
VQSAAGRGILVPFVLRCEYLIDPLGIDNSEPRLSWIVDSGQRGQRQTAYQILVSTCPETFERPADTTLGS